MAGTTMDDARTVLNTSMEKAEVMLQDPNQVDDLLGQVKDRFTELPLTLGDALSNIPLMAAMIKGYITQEYTEVSPKVIASVLGALLYLVKGKDLIPDSIPLLGLVDDVAVIALAMKLNEKELDAFKQWQKAQGGLLSSFIPGGKTQA